MEQALTPEVAAIIKPTWHYMGAAIGFGLTALVFAALIALVSAPMWLSGRARLPDGH